MVRWRLGTDRSLPGELLGHSSAGVMLHGRVWGTSRGHCPRVGGATDLGCQGQSRVDIRETPGQSWPLKVAAGEGCRAEGEGEAGALGDEQEMPGPPKSQGWGHGPAGPLWLFRDGDGHPAGTGVAGLRKTNITGWRTGGGSIGGRSSPLPGFRSAGPHC